MQTFINMTLVALAMICYESASLAPALADTSISPRALVLSAYTPPDASVADILERLDKRQRGIQQVNSCERSCEVVYRHCLQVGRNRSDCQDENWSCRRAC